MIWQFLTLAHNIIMKNWQTSDLILAAETCERNGETGKFYAALKKELDIRFEERRQEILEIMRRPDK